MVCPLRFVSAAASILLLAATLHFYLFGWGEEPAFLRAEAHKGRTWWRFFTAFFTGELLFEAWYGEAYWQGSVPEEQAESAPGSAVEGTAAAAAPERKEE